MNYLKSLAAQPEDVFREVVYLTEFLLCRPDVTQRQVDGLWANLVNDIRLWEHCVPDEDKMMVAGTVFCITRDALGHYWKLQYNEDIYEMLSSTLDKKHTVCDEGEEQDFLTHLTECSELLNEWINGYEDEEEWLSDKIEGCLRKRKPDPKPYVEPKSAKDYSRYSFRLTPKGRFKGKIEKLLEWLHDELVERKYIIDYDSPTDDDYLRNLDMEERNRLIFNEVFSGADVNSHIVWIGDKVALRYFILQLIHRGALSWKKGPGKWQITRNRIWYRQKENLHSDATGRQYPNYTFVQFGEHDLDKGNKPSNTTELDAILDVIAPPVQKKKGIKEEINDEFREHGDYEATHESSRGGKLSNGFRDTTHKAQE